jgi:hypothetical protein
MAANGNVSVLSSGVSPGRPVTDSPSMYVICHVIVNVTYHVIIDPEGGRRSAGRSSETAALPARD